MRIRDCFGSPLKKSFRVFAPAIGFPLAGAFYLQSVKTLTYCANILAVWGICSTFGVPKRLIGGATPTSADNPKRFKQHYV